MNPLQILRILRARYVIVLSAALATVAAAVAASLLLPQKYFAETSVMVDIKAPDPIAAVLLPSMMIPGNMGTQLDIIKSDRVAGKVVKMLKLDENPAVKEQWHQSTNGRGKLDDWLVKLLQRNLKITASRDSNLINIAYTGGDPDFVAAVANAYAQAYIEASIELKVEPARQYARWFGDQAKVLRENFEKAQSRLSDYQQQKGIVASAENLDYETVKLNDLSARLTAAQGETADARSKQRSGTGATDTLPEVMQNPVVAALRTDIVQREGRLKEAAGNLGKNHPQYLRMESELAELKNRLEEETRRVTTGYSASSAVGVIKQADLAAAIEAQKKKVLQLKKQRDEIAFLTRDVEAASKAYDAVNNRFNQTSLESQSTQTNISVLTPAIAPLEPSFPKPMPLTILASLAAGILLGGALAYLLEMLDHRVRSIEDLSEMLPLPVLGVIERSRPPRRLAFGGHRPALAAK
jgi:chain length determinant protein EpsF